jgi:N-hydroxyarylamine O-acetyltransferase
VNNERITAYLARIGYHGTPAADLTTLRALQRSHLLTVPFENLDIHLGRPIVLNVDAIVGKVVDQRRGGFCYELNGAFAALLAALGFEVEMLEGRANTDDTPGVPFDHLTLRVTIGDNSYLADVGFGAFSDEPLDLADRGDQPDTAGVFRIVDRDDGWVDVLQDGAKTFRYSPTPRVLQDFQPGCTHHQTSPDSHFTKRTVCSLRTPRGRVTVSELTITETEDGIKTIGNVPAGELGQVLADRFGVLLDAAAIERLIPADARPQPSE